MIDVYFEIIAIRTIKENKRLTVDRIFKKCAEKGVERADIDRIVDETPALLPESFVKRWLKARQGEKAESPVETSVKTPAASDPDMSRPKEPPQTTRLSEARQRESREKAARVLAYWDAHSGARIIEVAKETGTSEKFVLRTLKRERGYIPRRYLSIEERRAEALAYYEKNPGATTLEATRALGSQRKPCDFFRSLGVGPWTGELEANKHLAKRYKEGVDDAAEERFVEMAFEPSNPIRPYVDETYRESLQEGYDGFYYAGETWSRYYECYVHKRRGESLQIDEDGTKRWSSKGIHNGINSLPRKDVAPRVYSAAPTNL